MSSSTALVLIVGDGSDIRAALESTTDDVEVLTLSDADFPSATVGNVVPNLVISDLRGTRVAGGKLCRRIRRDPDLAACPILVLVSASDACTNETAEAVAHSPDTVVEELRALVAHHLTLAEDPSFTEKPPGRCLSRAVEAYVEQHLGEPELTTRQLAEAVDLSRRQLTRRMKEDMGTTPATFIRDRRMRWAEQLLRRDPETITDVADAVGFRSASAFSKTFREHAGMTPSAYVQRYAR